MTEAESKSLNKLNFLFYYQNEKKLFTGEVMKFKIKKRKLLAVCSFDKD